MRYMPNGSDVERGLSRDDIWVERVDLLNLEVLEILECKPILLPQLFFLSLNDFLSIELEFVAIFHL